MTSPLMVDPKSEMKLSRKKSGTFVAAVAVLAACSMVGAHYVLPHLVFDTSSPALVSDEEYYDGTDLRIAFGPKPIWIFPPKDAHGYYTGGELPLRVFSEFSRSWRIDHGKAPPRWHRDRRENFPYPH